MTAPGQAEDAGTLEVSVVAELRNFLGELRRKVNDAAAAVKAKVEAEAETAKFRAEVLAAAKEMSAVAKAKVTVDADTNPARKAISALVSVLKGLGPVLLKTIMVGAIAGGISLLGAAAGAAASKLIAFTAAIAPAWQAIGLLPGVLAAAISIFATFKVALSGVGDALKQTFSAYATLASGAQLTAAEQEKLNAALEKLAPSARAFVIEISKLAPAFTELRLDVQEKFFSGLGSAIGDLVRSALPSLRSGLGGIAVAINSGLLFSIGQLNNAATNLNLDTIFANTAVVAGELFHALGPILNALLDIASVGSDFLPGLVGGLGEAAQHFAEFIRTAKESGQLKEFISTGLSVLGQIGSSLLNLASGIGAVFRAANVASGGGTLTAFQMLMETFARWANSDVGQSALISFFTSLNQIGTALQPVFMALAQAIGFGLAPAIAAIVTNLAPFAVTFVEQLGAGLQQLTPLVGPLAQAFGQLAVSILPIVTALIVGALPGLTDLIAGLADAMVALAPAAGPVGTALGLIASAVAPLLPVLGAALAGALVVVAGLLTEIATLATPFIQLFSTAATEIAKSFMPVLLDVIQNGIGPLTAVAMAFMAALRPLVPVILQLATVIAAQLLAYLPQLQQILASQVVPVLFQVAQVIGQSLLQAFVQLIPYIPKLVQAGLELFGAFTKLFVALVPLLPSLLQLLFVGIQLAPTFLELLPTLVDLVKVVTDLLILATPFIDGILRLVAASLQWHTQFGVINLVMDAVRINIQLFTAILGFLIGVVVNVVAALGTFAYMAGSLVGSALRSVGDAINGVIGWVSGLAGSLYSAGVNLISGFVSGIRDSAWRVWQAVENVIGGVPTAVKKLLGIASPSKVFMEIGRQVGQGYEVGMDQSRESVARAAARLGNAVFNGTDQIVSQSALAGGPTGGGLGGGLNVEHLEVKAFSDRFSLRQVQDELALHATH